MPTPTDELLYVREKMNRGADLTKIGLLLKAEWALDDMEVTRVLRAFFPDEEEGA